MDWNDEEGTASLWPIRCMTCGKVLATKKIMDEYKRVLEETGNVEAALNSLEKFKVVRVCCKMSIQNPSIIPQNVLENTQKMCEIEKRVEEKIAELSLTSSPMVNPSGIKPKHSSLSLPVRPGVGSGKNLPSHLQSKQEVISRVPLDDEARNYIAR